MTIANTVIHRVHNSPYETWGFLVSSLTSSIHFSEFLDKALEVCIFAFLTGAIGAFGAHLYKLLINKLSNDKKDETKSQEGL